MTDLISIEQAVSNFKELIEGSIFEGGTAGKQAMIRSSKPINNIHEAVKSALIINGIPKHRIFPPLGKSTPELKLAGFLKQKYQDVCIAPEGKDASKEVLTEGLLQESTDFYGKEYTERTISINIRSQISSLAKNFDTLYERTIAEAQNLHVRCPRMCLGEVYMIAVPEYSSDGFKSKEVVYLDRAGTVEKYVKSFQAINSRTDTNKDHFKYERVCLLIVDFSQPIPKIYNTDDELKEAGLLPDNSDASISDLTWKTFTSTLLKVYQTRFGM